MRNAYYIMLGRMVEAIQRYRPSLLLFVGSIQCEKVLQLLYQGGYIRSYEVIDLKRIKVNLKYVKGKSYIKGIGLMTTPGRQISASYTNLRRFTSYSTICVVSTKKGLLFSDKLLKEVSAGLQLKTGGIMLFSIRI